MSFAQFPFSLLECPYCRSPLEFTPVQQSDHNEDRYGILSCCCYDYPVIDGVPIIRKQAVSVQTHVTGTTQISGPTPDLLTALISQHKGQEALLRMITFPWCPSVFKKVRLLRRVIHRNPIREIGLVMRKRHLQKWISDQYDSLTAEDWFALFYNRSLIYGDLFSYFFYRFAQPRHLAALSLMATFPHYKKPLLDLACGFGHLAYYLTECEKNHEVVAFDRNFFQLWVGKHWIAPKAHFICGDADLSLPFKNSIFSGVLCSDAFHYFQNKSECVNEMHRCAGAPQGTIILSRVGNQGVRPNEGTELSACDYKDLFKESECRLLGETELMNRYLMKLGADLSNMNTPESLKNEKWLSIIESSDPKIFVDHGKFESWPHGMGTLGLNPIYRQRRSPVHDRIELSFHFPSPWFAFENERMTAYHPLTIDLRRHIYEEIRNNQRTENIDELISKFVVLGMPRKYARSEE